MCKCLMCSLALTVIWIGSARATIVFDKDRSISKEWVGASQNGSYEQKYYEIVVPADQRATVTVRRVSLTAKNCTGTMKVEVDGGERMLNRDGDVVTAGFDMGTHTVHVWVNVGTVFTYEEVYECGFTYVLGEKIPQYCSRQVPYTAYSVDGQYDVDVSYESLLPDLVVSSLTTMPSGAVVENEDVTLNFTVMNSGGKAAGSFTGIVLVDDSPKESFTVSGLPASGSKSMEVFLGKLAPGTHSLRIDIDADDAVVESSDANNGKSQAVISYPHVPVLVSFETHDGVRTTERTIMAGDKLSDLPVPARRGYAFAGWWTAASGGSRVAEGERVFEPRTCHAHWTANRTTVTLNSRGGDRPVSSVTATFGSPLPTTAVPTRAGYAFNGYWTAVDGGTCIFSATGEGVFKWTTDAKTATLYAHWTPLAETLMLDLRDGSGDTNTVSANYAENLPSVSVPVRDGWVFGGFFSEPNGAGEQYYDADGKGLDVNVLYGGAKTLYAFWHPVDPNCLLRMDFQGGTNGADSVSAVYGEALPDVTCPVRGQYAFSGYYSEPDGGGTQYYDADGKGVRRWDVVASSVTLYAKWTKACRVILDPNGGMGESVVHYFSKPTQWTLPTNTFSRSDYVFAGWSLKADEGPVFADGEGNVLASKLGIGDDPNAAPVTLYAQWGKPLDGGRIFPGIVFFTGGPVDDVVWHGSGSDYKYSPARSGKSWLCAKFNDRVAFSFKVENSKPKLVDFHYTFVTRFYVFDRVVLSDSYGDGTGDVVQGPHLITFNADKKMISCADTDDPDELQILLTQTESEYNDLCRQIAYAAILLVKKTVANPAVNWTSSMQQRSEAAIGKAVDMCAQYGLGYRPSDLAACIRRCLSEEAGANVKYFNDWSESKAFRDLCSQFEPICLKKNEMRDFINASVRLIKLTWCVTHPVRFVQLSGDMENEIACVDGNSRLEGKPLGALPIVNDIEGFTFDGWWTEKTGGVRVTEEAVVEADVTYYSHWKPIVFNVKFDVAGGTAVSDRTVPFGARLGELPQVARDGYTLVGWYDAKTDGKPVSPYGEITRSATFYAIWTENADVEDTFVDQKLSLSGAGWHEVSFPVLPEGRKPEDVFASIEDKISYVTFGSQNWNPLSGGTLAALEIGTGYWVQTKAENVSWTVTGQGNPDVEIALKPGWNLIGYPLLEESEIETVLATALATGNIRYIYSGSRVYPGALTTMTPGKGYWVYAEAAATIRFDVK